MIEKEMKMKRRLLLVVLIMGASIVVQSGCGTSPHSRFYILSTPDSPEAKAPADDRCLSLGIGPIDIPDYLDRPQIVTRTTPSEIFLAEFDRWSESLKDNITRVLAKNLSLMLCTKTVAVFPWNVGTPIDYRIEIRVLRLDGSLGGDVFLDASWMVLSGDRTRLLFSKDSNFAETTGGKDYNSFVVAESRALRHLSGEIAEAIRTLAKST